MGIPLLRGRYFTPADKEGAQLVMVVNHKLAQQTWPGQDPVGKRMRIGLEKLQTPWATAVGEVAPDIPAKQQFYMTIRQSEASLGALANPADLNGNGGYIAVRTAMPPEQMEKRTHCHCAFHRSAASPDSGADHGACHPRAKPRAASTRF